MGPSREIRGKYLHSFRKETMNITWHYKPSEQYRHSGSLVLKTSQVPMPSPECQIRPSIFGLIVVRRDIQYLFNHFLVHRSVSPFKLDKFSGDVLNWQDIFPGFESLCCRIVPVAKL